MRYANKATHADTVVVISGAVLMLLTLGAVGPTGRERAKRAVCLSNLRQLSQAWRLYAMDNDGRIVSGEAGTSYLSTGLAAEPWVGRCWADNYGAGAQLPEAQQRRAIQEGALWPYTQDVKLYRCPGGYRGEMLNYAIVDSMNGRARDGTAYSNSGVRIGETVLWVRNLNEIITPGPAQRMVFIDEGWTTPDSFAVHYVQEAWWDDPPVRHDDGATVSFADGHTEYWQWQGMETIEYGRQSDRTHYGNSFRPQTTEGKEDLHRLQRAVWGRLGYSPTQ